MIKDIWTIEINQDGDFSNACAYHIDNLAKTSQRNLKIACEGTKSNRWALVGLANSLEEANEKCNRLRKELCKMHDRLDVMRELTEAIHLEMKEIFSCKPLEMKERFSWQPLRYRRWKPFRYRGKE